ncbi:hypothetical protein [Sciscionella marina]|uniref:hypothetical protein n=1 Tax=Sciscionella marina TaxID=508770 RepID=UPI0003A9B020|nr:hypothetical protein [Sciscionella marina]
MTGDRKTEAAAPITTLLDSSYGYDRETLVLRAQQQWNSQFGTQRPWEQATDNEQQQWLHLVAGQILQCFHEAPDPADSVIPIDHSAPFSPPYPAGADELAHWHRRAAQSIDWYRYRAHTDGLHIAGDTDQPQHLVLQPAWDSPDLPDEHVRGELDERISFLRMLDHRRPRPSGVDELAELITAQAARVQHTETGLRSGVDNYRRRRHSEAQSWLSLLRDRQHNRATPHLWRTGGPALVRALETHAPHLLLTETDRVPEALIVIAVHDHAPDKPFDLFDEIQAYAGIWDEHAIENTLHSAIAGGLVCLQPELGALQLTETGQRRYQNLLDTIRNTPPNPDG